MIVCGIDEAGRGPVIGPLVMSGASFDEADVAKLAELGVKDSKDLSVKQRNFLFEEIKKLAKSFEIVSTSAAEIDSRAATGTNLNQLEVLKAAEIINKLNPDIVYIDSPTSPRAEKFGEMIKPHLNNQNIKVISEHKADILHKEVGAASILAKVTRDAAVDKIKQETKLDLGSGYPSDLITVKVLAENWKGVLSKYIRHSWKTIKELKNKELQSSLEGFV